METDQEQRDMATKTRVVRTKRRGLTKTTLVTWFRQWNAADREAKTATARKNEIRDQLMEALEREGYEDDAGHAYLDLPEEIDGVTKLCRQRRVSQGVNADRAEAFLKERDLWKRASKTVRVLEDDKLAKLVFDGEITQEEFDSLIDRRETFAFVPVK